MTDLVKYETNKIQAREVYSDFENHVRKEICVWAHAMFGDDYFMMDYIDCCKAYWKDYFKDAGAIRVVRNL
jgi:hypothetical protein